MRTIKRLLGLLLCVLVTLVVTSRGVRTDGGAITLSQFTGFAFNNPIGIDFHEPNGGNLIVSVNWFSGSPNNLDLINVTTRTVSRFSDLANLEDELKIATQRTTACAQFPVGDVFTGNGQPGEIVRLNAAGLVYGPGDFNAPGDHLNAGNPNPGVAANKSWVRLPNSLPDDLLRGSVYVDRCNGFNGDLIVVTSIDTPFPINGGGAVWRISKTGVATMLNGGNRILRSVGDHCAAGQICGVHLEGVITVPTSFGPPWGNTIIAGDENDTTDLSRDGKIWSIPASGPARAFNLAFDSGGVHYPVKPEDLDIIDSGETFFGVNFGNSRILTAPPSDFAGSAGDILVTQEFPCGSAHSAVVHPCAGSEGRTTGLYAIHSNGTSLTITPFTFSQGSVTNVDTWEHVTFAPLPLPAPSLSIVKKTNGTDNDTAPGPTVAVGSTVTWTYDVTNTGNVTLTGVVVTDDKVGPICTIGTLVAGASASCTKTGIAVAGQYENTGTVTGTPPTGPNVTASNPDHYFAAVPSIAIVKLTNGTNNDTGTGPLVAVGSTVTWTYNVTNTGNVTLTGVVVTDDKVGAICTIGTLAAGGTASCTKTGIATAGQYTNTGTVTGTPPSGPNVTASNPDHYFGRLLPLTLACPPATTGSLNMPFTSGLVVSGGTPPYTFSIAAGALPPGLDLNTSTGAITGTPTTLGTFAFTGKVVDSLGATAFSACTTACGPTSSVTWDLSSVPGTLGTSQGYTVNGITVTAYGFTNAGVPDNLYGKQQGGDESGIGIADSFLGQHEIDTLNFVQLDLQNLINAGATDALMTIGSVQEGEGYDVFGSNVLGVLGTQLVTNGQLDNTPFAVPAYGTYRYLGVRAFAVDVLLLAVAATPPGCTITITAAPQPSPAIGIVTLTNGTNNDTGTGPLVAVGSAVTWTYNVTNSGNVPLTGVAVTDDKAGAICTIGTLAAGGTGSCTKTGVAVAGQFTNTGAVTGTPPAGPNVTASNIDHYLGVRMNVAAAANGATATASSSFSAAFGAGGAIDGDHKGLNWGAGGAWADGTPGQYPDWLEVDFAGSQTIGEIDLFSLQDNYTAPAEPTVGMPFTLYGLTDFQVQWWNGTQWVTVPGGSIAGNTQVWRQLLFAPVTTSRIRVTVTGALASFSRIVEVEAYAAGVVQSPAAFAKTGPANGAMPGSGTVTLTWQASSGATSYEYCVDVVNNDACDSSWVPVGGQTSASVAVAPNSYWWQVRARNAAGTTDATGGWWRFTATAPGARVNVAASANGGTALASSSFSAAFGPNGAIDGDHKGLNWAAGGAWADGTPGQYPDSLEIDFAGPQTIGEIDLFSLQDNYTAPAEPTLGMPFTLYGLTDFQLQWWDGTQWVAVSGGSIAGNTQVWRQLLFAPLTTSRIRVTVTGALASFSRIVEVEAYTAGAMPAPGAFAKSTPVNGATPGGGAVTLTWQSSSAATSYEYCLDVTNNNACDGSWVSVGGQTSATVAVAPNTGYWWQVRARNVSGTTDASGGWWGFTTTAPAPRVNVAASANGGTATASSSFSAAFGANGAIDGDHKGLNWGAGGAWADGTPGVYPDWLEVAFAGPQTIDEIDLFSLQDNYTAPVEPTLGMPFTQYGVTDFQVQWWDGTQWVTVPGGSIAGNTQVRRQLLFAPVTTSRIRVTVTGALASFSRIVEIEAYTQP